MLTLVAVCAVLYFLFSPGILITIPPAGYKGWFFSEQTSLTAAAIAAVLFAVIAPMIFRALRINYSGYRGSEAFQAVVAPGGSIEPSSKEAEEIARKHLERAKAFLEKRGSGDVNPETGAMKDDDANVDDI